MSGASEASDQGVKGVCLWTVPMTPNGSLDIAGLVWSSVVDLRFGVLMVAPLHWPFQ